MDWRGNQVDFQVFGLCVHGAGRGLILRERFQGHVECEMPVKHVELKYFFKEGDII